jgi:hypothetical protein
MYWALGEKWKAMQFPKALFFFLLTKWRSKKIKVGFVISLTFLPVRLTVSRIEALKKVELSDSGKYYFSEEKLPFFHSFML